MYLDPSKDEQERSDGRRLSCVRDEEPCFACKLCNDRHGKIVKMILSSHKLCECPCDLSVLQVSYHLHKKIVKMLTHSHELCVCSCDLSIKPSRRDSHSIGVEMSVSPRKQCECPRDLSVMIACHHRKSMVEMMVVS